MSGIKGIIQTHRARMEASGLLRRQAPAALSPRTAAMRPSLLKVQAAIAERSDRFAVVQPSPLSVLFDYALPKLEPVLMGMQEVRVTRIIEHLCDHGQAMIGQREYLERLFHKLADQGEVIQKEGELELWVEDMKRLELEGFATEHYLRKALGPRIKEIMINEKGEIALALKRAKKKYDLQPLLNVRNLVSLDLSGNKVTDRELAFIRNCTGLRELDLSQNRITNAGLAHLAGLIALEKLSLFETQVDDGGLEHLRGLGRLRSLMLFATGVIGSGLKHLPEPSILRYLRLGGKGAAGMAHIARFTELESLGLFMCGILDEQVSYITPLTKLKELDLGDNHLTNAGVETLSSLPAIQKLDLFGNEAVNFNSAKHLKRFTQLKWLGLGETGFEPGRLPMLQAENPHLHIEDGENNLWGD